MGRGKQTKELVNALGLSRVMGISKRRLLYLVKDGRVKPCFRDIPGDRPLWTLERAIQIVNAYEKQKGQTFSRAQGMRFEEKVG